MSFTKTIKIQGIELTLRGEYQPEEKPGKVNPGCKERFDVMEVDLNGENIFPILDIIFDFGRLEGIDITEAIYKDQNRQDQELSDYLETLCGT